jgi:trk system potassium uptake protein TrkH
MRLSVVVHLTGLLVWMFAATLIAPAIVACVYREWHDASGFAGAAVITALLGTWMRRAGGAAAAQASERVRRVEGMATVAATWLVVAACAALPYLYAGFSPVDALFESMSGLTTTGATVLGEFSAVGRGLFFWRGLTHWVGGLGVIALFVAVLPRLAIGGRELFFAEAAGPTDEKLTPQLRQTALALWRLYAALTAAQTIALVLAGMTLFDAICHAMATMAAGGFSPHSMSVAGYNSAAIDWIVIVFMFMAGANFALQYRVIFGQPKALVVDDEMRAYAGLILLGSATVAVLLTQDGMDMVDAIRHGTFQVLSILTTTGFASVDFQLWSDQAKMVLLLLMFVGGCAGSAGGGPKIVRHVLMARYTLRELRRTLHPRAVLPVKLGGRVVPEHILRDVQVFMLFYLLTFAVGAAIVVVLGADLVTGISASIASLGNIGPGFEAVGPMANYAGLHPLSKVVLTLQMWIGRLEVLTVLVLFRFEPWRTSRWSAS